MVVGAGTVTAKRSNKWHAKPSARRPKQVDTASLGSSVSPLHTLFTLCMLTQPPLTAL